MSWVIQIALGGYLVFTLGTVAALFATILLPTSALPSPEVRIQGIARPEDHGPSPPAREPHSAR